VYAATQLDQREIHVIAKHLAFVRDQLLKPVVTTMLLRRAALFERKMTSFMLGLRLE
jgi:hypothetical protein